MLPFCSVFLFLLCVCVESLDKSMKGVFEEEGVEEGTLGMWEERGGELGGHVSERERL